MQRIGILGAGAWGTALAITARRAGRDVVLWAHDPETAAAIARDGENTVYLPGHPVDPAIAVTADIARACDADLILAVSPAQFLGAVCESAAPHWTPGVAAIVCAKGVERGSLRLMSAVAAEALPAGTPLGILSGPTFAAEVASGQPTAVTLACADATLGRTIMRAIGTHTFRPYLSDDLIGAQMGGAVKNVLAIACGIVAGKGMGDNPRAALITRGLAEMARLSVALGGRTETLMGLSGLGDLILTANSMQSRNYSLGVALGQGRSLADILGERKSVAEGVFSAEAVMGLARKTGIEMPICEAADQVLNHGAALNDVIRGLLSRPFRTETD